MSVLVSFFYLISKAKAIKTKLKQVGLNHNQKLPYSNHQQNEKVSYGMGKSNCKSYID